MWIFQIRLRSLVSPPPPDTPFLQVHIHDSLDIPKTTKQKRDKRLLEPYIPVIPLTPRSVKISSKILLHTSGRLYVSIRCILQNTEICVTSSGLFVSSIKISLDTTHFYRGYYSRFEEVIISHKTSLSETLSRPQILFLLNFSNFIYFFTHLINDFF